MDARRLAMLLAFGMLAACDAPTVPSELPGYDPHIPGTDLLYHWPLGHTIAVYAHAQGAPDGFDLRAAIQRANDLWADALRYREFDIRFVATPADADVAFHFDTDPVLDVTCADPPTGAAGITTFCVDSAVTELIGLPLVSGGASRVKFDVQISTSPARIPNATVFQRIVAHEFGHVIGVGGHSSATADLMFAGPMVDSPSGADAQTLRYVLHQPPDLRP